MQAFATAATRQQMSG